MAWRSSRDKDETADYQKAGDEAVAQGDEDAAAMFYGLAADTRRRDARNSNRTNANSRRG